MKGCTFPLPALLSISMLAAVGGSGYVSPVLALSSPVGYAAAWQCMSAPNGDWRCSPGPGQPYTLTLAEVRELRSEITNSLANLALKETDPRHPAVDPTERVLTLKKYEHHPMRSLAEEDWVGRLTSTASSWAEDQNMMPTPDLPAPSAGKAAEDDKVQHSILLSQWLKRARKRSSWEEVEKVETVSHLDDTRLLHNLANNSEEAREGQKRGTKSDKRNLSADQWLNKATARSSLTESDEDKHDHDHELVLSARSQDIKKPDTPSDQPSDPVPSQKTSTSAVNPLSPGTSLQSAPIVRNLGVEAKQLTRWQSQLAGSAPQIAQSRSDYGQGQALSMWDQEAKPLGAPSGQQPGSVFPQKTIDSPDNLLPPGMLQSAPIAQSPYAATKQSTRWQSRPAVPASQPAQIAQPQAATFSRPIGVGGQLLARQVSGQPLVSQGYVPAVAPVPAYAVAQPLSPLPDVEVTPAEREARAARFGTAHQTQDRTAYGMNTTTDHRSYVPRNTQSGRTDRPLASSVQYRSAPGGGNIPGMAERRRPQQPYYSYKNGRRSALAPSQPAANDQPSTLVQPGNTASHGQTVWSLTGQPLATHAPVPAPRQAPAPRQEVAGRTFAPRQAPAPRRAPAPDQTAAPRQAPTPSQTSALRQAFASRKASESGQVSALRQAFASRQASVPSQTVTSNQMFASRQASVSRQAPASSQQAFASRQAPVSRQASTSSQQAFASRQAPVLRQAPASSQQAFASRQASVSRQVPASSQQAFASRQAPVLRQAPASSQQAFASRQAPVSRQAPASSQQAFASRQAPVSRQAPASSQQAFASRQVPVSRQAPASSQQALASRQVPVSRQAPASSQRTFASRQVPAFQQAAQQQVAQQSYRYQADKRLAPPLPKYDATRPAWPRVTAADIIKQKPSQRRQFNRLPSTSPSDIFRSAASAPAAEQQQVPENNRMPEQSSVPASSIERFRQKIAEPDPIRSPYRSSVPQQPVTDRYEQTMSDTRDRFMGNGQTITQSSTYDDTYAYNAHGDTAVQPVSFNYQRSEAIRPVTLDQFFKAPGNHLTIQWLATTQPTQITHLRQRFPALRNATVVRFHRQGLLWYILLTGIYPNEYNANQLLNREPWKHIARELNPWVRSLGSIHKLDVVMSNTINAGSDAGQALAALPQGDYTIQWAIARTAGEIREIQARYPQLSGAEAIEIPRRGGSSYALVQGRYRDNLAAMDALRQPRMAMLANDLHPVTRPMASIRNSRPLPQAGFSHMSIPMDASVQRLLQAPDGTYTIQWLAANKPDVLADLQYRYPELNDAITVRFRRKDRDWYVLVQGEYPSSWAAQQALLQDPDMQELANKLNPWPRSVASLRNAVGS